MGRDERFESTVNDGAVAAGEDQDVKQEHRCLAPGLTVEWFDVEIRLEGLEFRPGEPGLGMVGFGSEPSLGFTFEDPNSADVIVGPMPTGAYDVALYDGGQEVARAPKAYVVEGRQIHDEIKVVGRLIDLDRATADGLQPGAAFPSTGEARVRIAALGPVQPGRYPLLVQPGMDPEH